jgi:dTDP-4-amino-4,6-dideoxygalactose transaminase
MKVPFLDLVSPHIELEAELLDICRTAFRSAAFIGGPAVENFEREFAAFCEADYCIGVSSGTDGLRFALIAAGVKPGDAVVTVPNTFIATTEAITQAGGYPVFVDVDERTYTIDPARLRQYLDRECTREPGSGRLLSKLTGAPVTAVVPVHLYGQMADMDEVLEIAAEFGLIVVEDACQAHGAQYYSSKEGRWRKAGSMGAAAAFSFYPGKNLGACGEAGAVTTNDEDIAGLCRRLRDHGQSAKYHHDIEGYNGRLDAIQAGLLNVKLPRLAAWNEARRGHAATYSRLLAPGADAVGTPHTPSSSRPAYHLYVVRVPDRKSLQDDLAAAGIGTGIHYPVPLHLSPPYRHLGYKPGDCPIAEDAARGILSLPMFPGLTNEAIGHVAESVLRSVAVVQGR